MKFAFLTKSKKKPHMQNDSGRKTPGRIGTRTEFIGSLKCLNDISVSGTFQGSITTSGQLHIERNGEVKGSEITARSIIVSGRMSGTTITAGTLELQTASFTEGMIVCNNFKCEKGARMRGTLDARHGGDPG